MSLRILHVVESLEPDAGSVSVLLGGLVSALRDRSIESEVMATNARSPAADLSGAARRLGEGALIHFHGWGDAAMRRLAALARRQRKPYVISPLGALTPGCHHGHTWAERLRKLLGGDRLVRAAAALAPLNFCERDSLAARFHHQQLHLLPYGLNVSEYEGPQGIAGELPPGPDGRCLLLLGPIHPIEGLVPFLKAFAEIGPEADGWRVVFAGRETGDWRKMLEAAIRRKGGAGRVTFTPAPDEAAQRAWLARASLVAAPSLQVRCPVSVLQAIAAGVPVVATDRVAPPGFNGAIEVCAPDREGLKRALHSLLTCTDEERAARAERARATAHAAFDWPVLVDSYVTFYKSLV